jgi:cytidyltransferase-like protein
MIDRATVELSHGKIVYTGGTFDLIHPGHVSLLRACHGMAGPNGLVVVALNTDEFVRQYKGRPTVMSFDDRRDVLRAIRYVDRVVTNFSGADSKPAIEFVHPHVIAIGDDWRTKNYYAQMGFDQAWLDERGIELRYVPLLEGRSSTRLRLTATDLMSL